MFRFGRRKASTAPSGDNGKDKDKGSNDNKGGNDNEGTQPTTGTVGTANAADAPKDTEDNGTLPQ